MTDNKYTDEEIIDALEVMVPHNEVCREVYDLILRQKSTIAKQEATLDKVRENNTRAKQILDNLRDDIDAELRKTRNDAIGEFAKEIIYDVLPHFDDGSNGLVIRMSFEICEKAKALINKETKLT